MAYSRLSLDKVLAAEPEITVIDLAIKTVDDHSRMNGCTFEHGAAGLAVWGLGLEPGARAEDMSENQRESLALVLEGLEIDCPHKTPPGVTGAGPSSNQGS